MEEYGVGVSDNISKEEKMSELKQLFLKIFRIK